MKKLVCSPRMTSFFLRVAMSHARENRKPAYACSHAVSGFSIFSYTANAATASSPSELSEHAFLFATWRHGSLRSAKCRVISRARTQ